MLCSISYCNGLNCPLNFGDLDPDFKITMGFTLITGFICVSEISGKSKFLGGQGIVREVEDQSGKNGILLNCQGNIREFYISDI